MGEVRNMKCSSCGENIKGEPVWKDDEPYCSEECAEAGSFDEEDYDEDEDEER
jgi:NAD-dependent SIR2 family protein deacetylase